MNKKNILIGGLIIVVVSMLLIIGSQYAASKNYTIFKEKAAAKKTLETKVNSNDVTINLKKINDKIANFMFAINVDNISDFNKMSDFDKFCVGTRNLVATKKEQEEGILYTYQRSEINKELASVFGKGVSLTGALSTKIPTIMGYNSITSSLSKCSYLFHDGVNYNANTDTYSGLVRAAGYGEGEEHNLYKVLEKITVTDENIKLNYRVMYGHSANYWCTDGKSEYSLYRNPNLTDKIASVELLPTGNEDGSCYPKYTANIDSYEDYLSQGYIYQYTLSNDRDLNLIEFNKIK